MKTIGELWIDSGSLTGLKVRWNDWGVRFKFFEIEGIDDNTQRIYGVLDNGEKISYEPNSKNWKIYEAGDELCARAV